MEMSVHATESFDIEEEYKNTLRTQSNACFLSKKQRPEEEMEVFLDTQQDDFTSLMLQNTVLMRRSAAPTEMELALADYFDASAEALEMCRQLLRNVKSTQRNYRSMDRFLAAMAADSTASTSSRASLAVAEEPPFPVRSNPFCTTTRSNFRQIHDKCSSILHTIRSSHGRVARKLKIVKAVKKLSRTLLVIASVAAAAAAIGAGPYLLFLIGLLIGPAAAAGLCQIALKRRPLTATTTKGRSGGKITTALSLLQDQLDTAAKGTYVLGRDLDTLNQLVARISDGIERENDMAWRCVEAASDRCPAAVLEMVSELRRSCSASGRLAEELEEHVCLCLATIHKARVLVIHEIPKKA
ncbi:unnamed protein product [Miscanthus lutarioriparius]|uniref:Uncharacterized protein n=1 Tax=Miscanthus lutarioriparius TaxID=422564 RepID=A0A811R1E4_9POAL|nr:unnamed protein product [Miscanthus lutarioriparius]